MCWTDYLNNRVSFNRTDLRDAFVSDGICMSPSVFKKELNKLLDEGKIARVGRNAYCIPVNEEASYDYTYSQLAEDVADIMKTNHPFLEFSITELIQINEFVNHQIAHNILFLSVEDDLKEFVFETLKEKYPGKVLLNPSVELFHQYWSENMIVIQKLTTEAPRSKNEPWKARLEKLLVDLLTESLWLESIGESELPTIYEDAFLRYIIDESCLFRYAARRNAEKRIRTFIAEQTTITLRIKR